MILNVIFFIGLLSVVVNSRSTTEANKIHNTLHGFIPYGQRPIATIMSFCGGPISITAIVIWGFISLKWYVVIASWLICGSICRFIVEKKFNFPLSIKTLFYSDLYSIISSIILWVVYFIK